MAYRIEMAYRRINRRSMKSVSENGASCNRRNIGVAKKARNNMAYRNKRMRQQAAWQMKAEKRRHRASINNVAVAKEKSASAAK